VRQINLVIRCKSVNRGTMLPNLEVRIVLNNSESRFAHVSPHHGPLSRAYVLDPFVIST
jgi:hypothetical protein